MFAVLQAPRTEAPLDWRQIASRGLEHDKSLEHSLATPFFRTAASDAATIAEKEVKRGMGVADMTGVGGSDTATIAQRDDRVMGSK